MSEPASVIPKPEAGDADDVSTALETAAMLWTKGDSAESIRWIRRAAEAAGEAGNDMRALALARAAADLNATAPAPQPQAQPSKPPPLPVDGIVTSAPPIAGSGPAVAPSTSGASVASFSVAARGASSRPNSTASRAAPAAGATHEPVQSVRKPAPANAPPPPSARGEAAPRRPSGSALPAVGAAAPREAEAPRRSSSTNLPAAGGSVNPLVSKALAAGEEEEQSAQPPPARSSLPPSAHPSVAAAARKATVSTAPAAPRGRQTLRVAVRPSSDEKSLLLVRVLEDGQAVPHDAHEALLVGLESGVILTSRKS